MGLFSLLGVLSPAHITYKTWFSGGRCVGRDNTGNRYYRARLARGAQSTIRKERRWVIYKGTPEATKVPPEWHGWLHYQTDTIPESGVVSFRRPWQKPHRPNMTGTNLAYRPPGHVLSGGKRAPASGDYQAWSPDQD